MARRKIPNFKNLTPREKRKLARCMKAWRREIQPMLDAIDDSTRITADDLAIRIGPAPLEPQGHALTQKDIEKIQEAHDHWEEQMKKHPLKVLPLPKSIRSKKPSP